MRPTLDTLEVIAAIRKEQRTEERDTKRDAHVGPFTRSILGPPTTPDEAFDRAIDAVLALASRDDARAV